MTLSVNPNVVNRRTTKFLKNSIQKPESEIYGHIASESVLTNKPEEHWKIDISGGQHWKLILLF